MEKEPTLFASKIYDDVRRIRAYSEQLLSLVKKEFRIRKINQYDYEQFINYLTCLNLQTDETKYEIERFIDKETNKPFSIDLRA